VEETALGEGFGGFREREESFPEPDVKELQPRSGRLTMENDFLAVALGRIDGSSVKK